MVKWLALGTVSHTGTLLGPHWSRIAAAWRLNSALSSPPTAVYSGRRGLTPRASLRVS